MLVVRTVTYKIKQSAETVFSRIIWQVENSSELTNMYGITADTSKPWVGKIDRVRQTFRIIEANPTPFWGIFDGNFFDIFISGRLTPTHEGLRADVRFSLEWKHPAMWILLTVLGVLVLSRAMQNPQPVSMETYLLPVFCIMIYILVLVVQLNRLKNKVGDWLGVANR